MVNIAICDDEKDTLLKLEQLIYECFEQIGNGTKCRVDSFTNGNFLLEKSVNQDYISSINSGCIIMKNGDKIYGSRSGMKNFSDEYLRYKLEKLK